MEEWNKEFHSVSVRFKEHLIQVKTDQVLMDFLAEEGRGAVELAAWIRSQYEMQLRMSLDISEDSLSIEILIHAYMDRFSRHVEKFTEIFGKTLGNPLAALCRKVEYHTEIIDCGEKSVDSNRWVFDALVPFHGILYGMLGKNA